MSIPIPKIIDAEEILVRFIFSNVLKRADKIKVGEVFMHYRGGVSMQRYSYADENKCKGYARGIDLPFEGFVIFKKKVFTETVNELKEERESFEAELVSTPIDENNEYYEDLETITIDTPGNPSHADIKYIDPAPSPNETPKTAIRYFSRKLFKKVKWLKEDLDSPYEGERFSKIIS